MTAEIWTSRLSCSPTKARLQGLCGASPVPVVSPDSRSGWESSSLGPLIPPTRSLGCGFAG
eukprot:12276078-Prorocentrum_lima.AAC.1